MRYLLYLLVVLNLLLLLWIYQFDEQLQPQQGGRPAVGQLRVVSKEALQQARMREQHATDEDVQQSLQEMQLQHAHEDAADIPPGDLCTSLGPLASSRRAKDIAARLATMKQQATVRGEVVMIDTYEVIIPPFDSRFAATRKLQELQRSGIEGAEKIRAGKYLKGITLGVYHYRDDAQRRLLGISHVAQNAAVVARSAQRERYWVDVDSRLLEDLSQQQVATIRNQFSGVEFHEGSCSKTQ